MTHGKASRLKENWRISLEFISDSKTRSKSLLIFSSISVTFSATKL